MKVKSELLSKKHDCYVMYFIHGYFRLPHGQSLHEREVALRQGMHLFQGMYSAVVDRNEKYF